MFNKRWKRVLAWSLSVVVILAIGGLFAANYAVDKLMSTMATGVDIELRNSSNSELTEEEISSPPTTASPDGKNNDNTTNVSQTTSNNSSEKNQTTLTQTNNDNTSTVKVDENESSPAPTISPTPIITPSTVGKDEGSTNAKEYVSDVSVDKAKKIQEDVTIKEKADVASIVMGQLSVSDIKRLQDLASGGLTDEEKNEARRIVFDNVSPDQYNDLIKIAQKYGISQGRTYSEVSSEVKGSEE